MQEPQYIVEESKTLHYEQDKPSTSTTAFEESTGSNDKVYKQLKGKDDEIFWDRNRIKLLLTLCLENKNIEKNDVWEEISGTVGAAPEECNAKYRHLRRTYLRLLKKKRLGKDIKWVHYSICEEVFTDLKALPASVLEPWEDAKVRRLLSLYIENIHRFRNPNCFHKDIWREIASALGTTGYNCYHKFKNLRRSYMNWVSRSQETGRGIKWPYHHYFERIFYNYNPCSKSWDRNKIKQLLDAYSHLAHKFRNPKYQKKELWQKISQKVGETPDMCDKKFRNLKQTYVRLKMKANSGRLTTKWRYYRDFEAIYTNATRYIDIDGTPKTVYKTTLEDEDYKKRLLSFYIENKEKFRDPLTKNKTLWKMIAPKLGFTSEECDKKFRNLKQTYIRLAWKKKQTGKCSKWPYYSYFEKIFEAPGMSPRQSNSHGDFNDVVMSEIKRVVEDVRERKDSDKKFERLVKAVDESNDIQRERNKILQALLEREHYIVRR